MEKNKKRNFDDLGFSELMKRPKPELCDYVLALREEEETVQAPVYNKIDTKNVLLPYTISEIDTKDTVVEKNDFKPDFSVVKKKESADKPSFPENSLVDENGKKKRRGRKKKS